MRRFMMAAVVALLVGVPSVYAQEISLVTADSGSGTAETGGEFLVEWVDAQSTGTGVIDSFLRVQAPGSSDFEEGYNLNWQVEGLPMDDVGGQFTRLLTLGEVPIVVINGVEYREFLLDINQTNADSLLTLNQVQIFLSSGGAPDGLVSALEGDDPSLPNNPFGDAAEVFQMSGAGVDNFITLDYARNAGSGAGDMLLYVANSNFANGTDNSYVTLYTHFGTPPGDNNTNDGFEEWSVRLGEPPTTVPEPTTLLLLGLGMLGLGVVRRHSGQ